MINQDRVIDLRNRVERVGAVLALPQYIKWIDPQSQNYVLNETEYMIQSMEHDLTEMERNFME